MRIECSAGLTELVKMQKMSVQTSSACDPTKWIPRLHTCEAKDNNLSQYVFDPYAINACNVKRVFAM